MIGTPLFANSQSDTSKIELPVRTARLVLKDLVEKDYLEKQLISLELQLNTQNEIIQNKDAETDNLNGQIEAFESLVISKDNRIKNDEKVIKNQEKEIRKKSNGSLFWKIATGLAVTFGVISSLK